jgi:hypothetical protein
MAKEIGLVMVDVPEEVLGVTRFVLHHCGAKLKPVPARELRQARTWRNLAGLVIPGGGPELYHRDLGKAGIAHLKGFVDAGGGCVGICAGCIFAFQIGLLTGTLFSMPGIGIYRLQNRKPHPIFRGLRPGSLSLPRVNGPFIEVAAPTRSLADYDPSGRYACIVARNFGKGRVVGFSAHPEGGLGWGGGDYNPWFFFDGKVQNTAPLLLNAIRWTSRSARG